MIGHVLLTARPSIDRVTVSFTPQIPPNRDSQIYDLYQAIQNVHPPYFLYIISNLRMLESIR